MTLLEYFMHQHKVTIGEARTELAKVLFIKDHVYKKIKNLSGGEKSRLKLCTLLYEKVNFMILDEPTNHLDIDSREVLENMLLGYDGTIVFVSHDRYFIQKVANKIMVLKSHNVRLYPMPYKDYLEEIQKELVDEPTEKKVKVPKKAIEKPIKKIDKSSQLAKLEKDMEALEEQLKQVEELMALNNTEADRLNELFIEKKQLEEKFEEIFIVWEKLLEEK
jgi:ATPase subunit of ABC transporter with duplicated ATPase domains